MDAIFDKIEDLIKPFGYTYRRETTEELMLEEFNNNHIQIFTLYHPDNKMIMSFNFITRKPDVKISYSSPKYKETEEEYMDERSCEYSLYISMWDDCVCPSMFVDDVDDCHFEDRYFYAEELEDVFERFIKPSILATLTGFKNGFDYEGIDDSVDMEFSKE